MESGLAGFSVPRLGRSRQLGAEDFRYDKCSIMYPSSLSESVTSPTNRNDFRSCPAGSFSRAVYRLANPPKKGFHCLKRKLPKGCSLILPTLCCKLVPCALPLGLTASRWAPLAGLAFMPAFRSLSFYYLALLPLGGALLGFTVAPVRPAVYVPLWGLNALLMAGAAWVLGAHRLSREAAPQRVTLVAAILLAAPWLLLSLLFGMGPPPATAAGYAAAATEQHIRYALLMGSGLLMFAGFTLLREQLKGRGENLYSLLGQAALTVALPLFLLNMLYWHSYLVEAFQGFGGAASRPAWYGPLRSLFGAISTVEVSLTYLATAAFARSLRSAGWLSLPASRLFGCCGLVGAGLALVPAAGPGPLATAGFVVSVPAIPLLIPYLFGIHLLRRSGTNAH